VLTYAPMSGWSGVPSSVSGLLDKIEVTVEESGANVTDKAVKIKINNIGPATGAGTASALHIDFDLEIEGEIIMDFHGVN